MSAAAAVCDSKSYKSKEPQELAGSSPHREASKDLQEEAAREECEGPEANQDQPGRSAGGGGTPVPGLAVGSTPLSPQEASLTDRLVLGGPRPYAPEMTQLSSSTRAVCAGRSQASPEDLSCPRASSRLPTQGEDQEAVGEPEASVPAWAASEMEKWPGTVETPASFLSPVSSRTRDMGRRQMSERSDAPESWLLADTATVRTADKTSPVCDSSLGTDPSESSSMAPRGALAKDSGTPGKGPMGELHLKATEATVCANNSKVSSTGEKVVLWTREADRVILTMCQQQGAQPQTFRGISQRLGNKTPTEVSHRFRELVQLFHTACEASSEDDDDATSTSNADQLSDRGDLLSEEELDG